MTHQHGNHNQIDLPVRNPGCRVITERDALCDGKYQHFAWMGCDIQAVPAYNRNHDRSCCVGYLITLDNVKIYAAGDTSRTEEMPKMASLDLDYALLPGDGIYNMDLEEASECAGLIRARRTIPIHLKPGALFDRSRAEAFQASGRQIVEPGEEISLTIKRG